MNSVMADDKVSLATKGRMIIALTIVSWLFCIGFFSVLWWIIAFAWAFVRGF